MTLPRDLPLTTPLERTSSVMVMTPVSTDRPINPDWKLGKRTGPGTPEQQEWDRERAQTPTPPKDKK